MGGLKKTFAVPSVNPFSEDFFEKYNRRKCAERTGLSFPRTHRIAPKFRCPASEGRRNMQAAAAASRLISDLPRKLVHFAGTTHFRSIETSPAASLANGSRSRRCARQRVLKYRMQQVPARFIERSAGCPSRGPKASRSPRSVAPLYSQRRHRQSRPVPPVVPGSRWNPHFPDKFPPNHAPGTSPPRENYGETPRTARVAYLKCENVICPQPGKYRIFCANFGFCRGFLGDFRRFQWISPKAWKLKGCLGCRITFERPTSNSN